MCCTSASCPGWTESCFRTSMSTRQKINSTAKSRFSDMNSSSDLARLSSLKVGEAKLKLRAVARNCVGHQMRLTSNQRQC